MKVHRNLQLPSGYQKTSEINVCQPAKNANLPSPNWPLLELLYRAHFLIPNRSEPEIILTITVTDARMPAYSSVVDRCRPTGVLENFVPDRIPSAHVWNGPGERNLRWRTVCHILIWAVGHRCGNASRLHTCLRAREGTFARKDFYVEIVLL